MCLCSETFKAYVNIWLNVKTSICLFFPSYYDQLTSTQADTIHGELSPRIIITCVSLRDAVILYSLTLFMFKDK